MHITAWYAIALGSLIASYILLSVIFSIGRVVQAHGKVFFLKHLFYPQIPRFVSISGKTTRFDLLILVAFLSANAFALSINVKDVPGLVGRSGLLSVINLMPLFAGGQMNIVASQCGIGLRAYARMHRWLGRVALMEGIIHFAAAWAIYHPRFDTLSEITGLLAAAIFLSILLSGFLRPRWYEIFFHSHLIFSVGAVAAIYLHTPTPLQASPTLYLFVGACLQILGGIVRFAQILYRNVKYKKPLPRAIIRRITYPNLNGDDIELSDAVHVHIRMARTWQPRAGQYIYLCVPGVSYTAFAQLHPFYIAWWYRDNDDYFAVLIVQKQKGFTKHLFMHRENFLARGPEEIALHKEHYLRGDAGMRAVIEGPYGKELCLDSYGTVLLFATGVGIAGQLSYVDQLLDGYLKCEVKTRRIALFWQVDSEIQTGWVANRLDRLLEEDTGQILEIHVFILDGFLPKPSKYTQPQPQARIPFGRRIIMNYKAIDCKEVIESEMNKRKGRTVICLCVNNEISDEIRRLLQDRVDDTISIKELDFRPRKYKSGNVGELSEGWEV